MDFTLKKYNELLDSLIKKKYNFQTFSGYLKSPKEKSIILRHDVDALPENSLNFARIQQARGIEGVFYFRNVPQSWDPRIIKEIALLGHEIGYHYENMDTCKGDVVKAYNDFKSNLKKFREIADIKSICMHGSPRSKYDNRSVWDKFNYKELNLVGEPYFDLDFSKTFYATDTARMWNGSKYSVRDKVVSSNFFPLYHSTNDLIYAINNNTFPNAVMLNFHPQRWTDNYIAWIKELIVQNIKNQIKNVLYVK